MDYQLLEERIKAWSAGEAAVHAVVVAGSRARVAHPADQWSDLDLILFGADLEPYAQDPAWLGRFGRVWLAVPNRTGAGDPEWLVLYAGGWKVDFVLAGLPADPARMLVDSPYQAVLARGYRLLACKGRPEAYIAPELEGASPAKPDEAAFLAAVQGFWLSAYRAETMLRRGDLWRAHALLDGPLRADLLRMMAWQAQAHRGPEVDSWYDGRFLEEWADPAALAALPGTFGLYEAEATRDALWATARLFNDLARDTAALWHYRFPAAVLDEVWAWMAAPRAPSTAVTDATSRA